MSTLDEIGNTFSAAEHNLEDTAGALQQLRSLAETMTSTLDAIGHDILVRQASNVVKKTDETLNALEHVNQLMGDLKMAISQAGA